MGSTDLTSEPNCCQREIPARTSSKKMNSMPASFIAWTLSLARSRNCREVMICLTPASWAQCHRWAAPVEKLKMVGIFSGPRG